MENEKEKDIPEKIGFHFKKTDTYRSYYADGAFGGLTPKGDLYLEFFIDRLATPQYIEQYVDENGVVGKEVPNSRQSKVGIIRQIEAGIVMNMNTAKNLKKWLEDKIVEFEELKKKAE